ncbi:SDR family oxidoreductase [Planctomycetota bacterium]|nr:SDR family oxidoreductase [Planctomycetota bacterium]
MEQGTQRTVALTGATRGLGRALAERLIEGGHRLVACGRSESLLEELEGLGGDRVFTRPVDVRSAAEVAAWAEEACARGMVPDLVIANAGKINDPAPLWEVSAEEFDAVLAVNVSGVANVMRALAPPMIQRGRGVLVGLSSGWGRFSSPEVAPYCASKFAVEGMISALAQELPDGMAAVAVGPGVIDTGMLRQVRGEAAGDCETPDVWSRRAAPFFLNLGAADNGGSVSVPSPGE